MTRNFSNTNDIPNSISDSVVKPHCLSDSTNLSERIALMEKKSILDYIDEYRENKKQKKWLEQKYAEKTTPDSTQNSIEQSTIFSPMFFSPIHIPFFSPISKPQNWDDSYPYSSTIEENEELEYLIKIHYTLNALDKIYLTQLQLTNPCNEIPLGKRYESIWDWDKTEKNKARLIHELNSFVPSIGEPVIRKNIDYTNRERLVHLDLD